MRAPPRARSSAGAGSEHGGGANGTNAYDATRATTSVNGETYNRIATLALTLGASIDTAALEGLAQTPAPVPR